MGINCDVLKEPRGFIKIIEFFLAIFAFAIAANSSINFTVKLDCPNNGTDQLHYTISYPFIIHQYKAPSCGNNSKALYGDYASDSQFFVAVGVLAMLYSMFALFGYIYYEDVYARNGSVAKADLIITCLFVFFWLIASITWAVGIAGIKTYTSSDRIFNESDSCKDEKCSMTSPAYAGLNVSALFGFGNILAWIFNTWFIWKEVSSQLHGPLAEQDGAYSVDGSPI